jgi:hypothetical protein
VDVELLEVALVQLCGKKKVNECNCDLTATDMVICAAMNELDYQSGDSKEKWLRFADWGTILVVAWTLLVCVGKGFAQQALPPPAGQRFLESGGVQTVAARQDQNSSIESTIPAYPNSALGLENLFHDMVSLLQRGERASLLPYLQSLALPNADVWFKAEFGDKGCEDQNLGPNGCLGPRMAWYYSATAKTLAPSFEMTLKDLISEGLINFEVVNQNAECAGPQRIQPSPKLVGSFTTVPVLSPVLSGLVQRNEPVYVLWAYDEGKETTINFFVYSQGAFRYIGMPRPAPPDDYREKKYGESAFPPLAPHHLTDDQLSMNPVIIKPSLVQRTVVVRVMVGQDGKPKEVSYLRGPESFKDAAIEKTRKRRFEPPGFGPRGIHPNVLCLDVVGRK